MKKSTGKKVIRDIGEFDESISLYQLVPGGRGKGIMFLKRIVDQIHQDKYSRAVSRKLLSIIIHGKEGKGTVARGFLRAVGSQEVRQAQSHFMEGESYLLALFNTSSPDAAYIMHNIEQLKDGLQSYLWQVIVEKKFSLFNFLTGLEETRSIRGIMIMTSSQLKKVSSQILDAVDFIVEIEPYSQQQLELIVLQRLKYSGLDYESEQILREIVEYGNGELKHIIRFLRGCYVVLRADGRDKLMMSDIEKVVKLG